MDQIRRATRSDIPQLIELGEEFATVTQFVHGFSVSRTRIIEFVNEIVDNSEAVVIVQELDGKVNGVIAGVVQRIFFSEDIALQELVWYVKKSGIGNVMMDHFEQAATDMKVNKVIVGNKPDFFELKSFYERRGYKLLENQFVRNVCQ